MPASVTVMRVPFSNDQSEFLVQAKFLLIDQMAGIDTEARFEYMDVDSFGQSQPHEQGLARLLTLPENALFRQAVPVSATAAR